jgi:sugar lactone lactonase YvrE
MKMIRILIAALLAFTAWNASYGETAPKTVPGNVRINDMAFTIDLVKQLLMKEVTLVMKVGSTGATKKGDLIFLNSSADFRSDDNFTVVLDKKAQEGMAKADIAMPRSHFADKTIRVVGKLTLYSDRPQIMVSDAVQIKVADQEAPIFEPGAKLKVEAEGDGGGEGPAWHPKLGVFSSGGDGHLHLLGRDGKQTIYRKKAGTNGLLFDSKGNLVSCDSEARRVSLTDLETGKVTILSEKYEGKRYNTPNDLTIDSKGRIYFSDPRYGKRDGMEILDDKGRTIEGVYRIDPDDKVTRIIGRELDRPNGVLVSADDRWLFVADNNNDKVGAARKLWRFDLKKDGTVDFASKKLLYNWGNGRGPDGIKQDREGRLYVAAGLNKPNEAEPAKDKKGGIYVFTPEGKLLTFLAVPRDEVTNCAFGGDDLKTLYITGGGTLYSIRTTTPGRVVWPMAK